MLVGVDSGNPVLREGNGGWIEFALGTGGNVDSSNRPGNGEPRALQCLDLEDKLGYKCRQIW